MAPLVRGSMARGRASDADSMEATRLFWNASPCGAQETFQERYRHRFGFEPWIEDVLRLIASRHRRVLEIGCGQGTDGIVLSSLIPKGGEYLGLDYSDESVSSARRAAREAAASLSLNVEPTFRTGNAERLEIADESVECVYSNGVLHHTANPGTAFAEVWRVLQPGGEAFIALYRKPSLKVGVAKALRGVQAALDAILRQDRCIYRRLEGRHMPRVLGTMLLEGFGVPVMEWYSRADILSIFRDFKIIRLTPVGYNAPRTRSTSRGWTPWGYLWFVHLQKPPVAPAHKSHDDTSHLDAR